MKIFFSQAEDFGKSTSFVATEDVRLWAESNAGNQVEAVERQVEKLGII